MRENIICEFERNGAVVLIIQQEYKCNSGPPSKVFKPKLNSYLPEMKMVSEDDFTLKEEKFAKRKQEILAFSTELKLFNLSYLILVSQKPKSLDEREQVLKMASFISSEPSARDYFLSIRKIPDKLLSKHFNFSTKFLKNNKYYLIALSLLLIGPYTEIKSYFLEEID